MEVSKNQRERYGILATGTKPTCRHLAGAFYVTEKVHGHMRRASTGGDNKTMYATQLPGSSFQLYPQSKHELRVSVKENAAGLSYQYGCVREPV